MRSCVPDPRRGASRPSCVLAVASRPIEELHGIAIPRTLEEACDPRRLALVVYDMQAGILGQIADRERVVAQVTRVLEAARAASVRTVFTRHVTLPTELMGASQMRMWMAWQRAERAADIVSPFPPDAPATQLVPELTPNPREAVLDKVTMSAFEGTPLDIVLRDCGIASVAIVGVALEVGVEPTVRHAADLGYLPIVVTDACAAGDPAAGERSLETLAFAGDALLTDTAGFARALAGLAPSGAAPGSTSARP
jgi:biuret amidohydrolase